MSGISNSTQAARSEQAWQMTELGRRAVDRHNGAQ
jgi:hypothetical protein